MDTNSIKNYLISKPEVMMAFIFGSVAADSAGSESDLDIAIYFNTTPQRIEWESGNQYPTEDQIWLDLERLSGREIDLVILNRASATMVDTVLRGGQVLFIRDKNIYLDLLLRVSREAEDYRDFIEEFWKIKYAQGS